MLLRAPHARVNALRPSLPKCGRPRIHSVTRASNQSDEYASLKEVALQAAEGGAAVVREALNKPRRITEKSSAADVVTETDVAAEAAIVDILQERYPGHAILGEEGGVMGASDSEYLWICDPIDGTTNFAHSYPSFAVSVGVVHRGIPVAGCVVEFVGGPHCWGSRTFTASKGGGAFCNGAPISVSGCDQVASSLLVTGFGYDHDEVWASNFEAFRHFTDVSQGVRRLGAASVDLCHVSLGIVEAYWEHRLKPWDVCAGVLLVTEAGGRVTTMDGKPFTVFDRSLVASNSKLHSEIIGVVKPPCEALIASGAMETARWFTPDGYAVDAS